MSYALQNKNSNEQNKLYHEDTSIHNWYRFVLSYPPHLVRKYLNEFNAGVNDIVLDPFCGTGTTLVESKKNGISSIGIEANPMACLASEAKISWNIDLSKFREVTDNISENANKEIIRKGNDLSKLSPITEKILIKNSISPIPLHKALVLLDEIKKYAIYPFYKHMLVGFAKQLVVSFSNLHFGPEVGVSKKKKLDVDVVDLWRKQMLDIIYDLQLQSFNIQTNSILNFGDSREQKLEKKIDIVITSPPYPNEKDYTRTTRLESVILGFIKNREDLRKYKKGLLRSNTRTVYKLDDDEKFILSNSNIMRLSKSIEDKRIELNKTSGFEKYYHRVVELYFGGMYRHLNSLKPHLNGGARLAYVVGDQASYFQVLIKTGEILAEIAEDLGYRIVKIDTFRTRLSTATKNYLNEEVVILSNR